ncbi:MAG: hypothetical protein JTT11_04800 [Candidatus Brockarchaeota archaeon]|nr:hypothetical protein [Candidatus Brockarchaeota archaeon]
MDEAGEQAGSEEETQKLAQLKKFLEEKIEALDREVEGLRAMSRIVDKELAARSFRRGTGEPVSPAVQPRRPISTGFAAAGAPAPTAPAAAPAFEERRMELVYRGRPVGSAYISANSVRIAPDEKFGLRTTTSPFESFLLRKVLDEIHETDTERAGRGEIRPDQILSYDVVEENTLLKEVVVNNYGDSDRLNRILRASAWTFMVMSQK